MNANGADVSAGGAERYVADLGSGLRERGYDVRLLAAAPARDDALAAETIVLHRRDWRDSVARRAANRLGELRRRPSAEVIRAIEAVAPDVVHTNTLPGITTGIWDACARRGIPVVHTLHDFYLLCLRTSLMRRDGRPCSTRPLVCEWRMRGVADDAGAVRHVIGVSRFIVDRHREVLSAAAPHVVRHPVPFVDVVSPPPRAPAVIGYLGRLESEKGAGLLAEAAPELRRGGFSILVAGDGRARRRVEDTAGIEYVGVVHGAAKERFLARCDVGIVPSLWPEPGGPPYTVLEWLAAGRPVLVTTRGGLAEAGALFAGVRSFEPTVEALVRAATAIRSERPAATPFSEGDADADRARWLDEHEQVYVAARAGREAAVETAAG
ncbi:MAG TPA: glycosyltransferase [Gaiellaceae bacterium]|nr:glycosyltransferase [Gaiellaceae bacterium]